MLTLKNFIIAMAMAAPIIAGIAGPTKVKPRDGNDNKPFVINGEDCFVLTLWQSDDTKVLGRGQDGRFTMQPFKVGTPSQLFHFTAVGDEGGEYLIFLQDVADQALAADRLGPVTNIGGESRIFGDAEDWVWGVQVSAGNPGAFEIENGHGSLDSDLGKGGGGLVGLAVANPSKRSQQWDLKEMPCPP